MAILFDITYVTRFMEDILQYIIIDRYDYTIGRFIHEHKIKLINRQLINNYI